jgi:uncharacterized membrane protein YhaH (DUF805 family)
MAAKINAFLITFLVNIAVGIAIFFGMLLAMNGYSETDAQWGIIAYVLLAIIVTLSMSAGAALLVHLLRKRQFGGVASVLIAAPIFSIAGSALKLVCSIIGVGIAEFARLNY